MNEILTVIAISSMAFIGTNLDNLVLLVAFYSRYRAQTRMVTAGYISGMILIAGICFVIGEAGDLIPVSYIGLLGIIPVIMGGLGLLQLFKAPGPDQAPELSFSSSGKATFLAVFMTQLSNSADTIVTFSVFHVDSADAPDYAIALSFLGMACIFAWAAFFSLKHRGLSDFLGHYGRYVTPVILILVGIYILSDTATDLV